MSKRYPSLYIDFFQCYHDGEYWEAHEVLEELWQTERANDFYHGLIQIAAICHQLERGKVRGARKLATSACGYLEAYRPFHQEVDVEGVIDWLQLCLERLPHSVGMIDPAEVKKMNLGIASLPRATDL
ncbi:DUF309 domain-containing protein [Mechercharimyces sp. CAU 1602]|uniref:DUF309 domain-containing protein n=1 Tax=Mechercharimyces sp. CAU 1602 TaxID=2973933 RepID=UPI002163B5AA|nr:DUF309 domain-containing protein [Mechercharimyces sp. CAU 1602]MCS1350088.1 DUF309 domain-containing protein [Mechercharimyces sp. CAU 1602]